MGEKVFPQVHFFLNRIKIAIELEREKIKYKFCEFKYWAYFCHPETVDVVQLVRTSDCGSEGRGFEPHLPPQTGKAATKRQPFLFEAPPAIGAQFCYPFSIFLYFKYAATDKPTNTATAIYANVGTGTGSPEA